MYKILNKIENLLKNEDITSYKIQVETKEKNYMITKYESEKQNTHAIGFEIPSRNEYEE